MDKLWGLGFLELINSEKSYKYFQSYEFISYKDLRFSYNV